MATDYNAQLIKKIEEKKAHIGIIGMGYVGLPLAITFAQKGFPVTGFDTDQHKCESILNCKTYIRHIPLDPVKKYIQKETFTATTDFARLSDVDAIIICVPTPLGDKRVPDLSALISTADTISHYLQKGQLIILESTTYPETTEEELLTRFASETMRPGVDFFLAFSPEREDPGNKKFSVTNIPKIVGGVTPACLQAALMLYDNITRTVPVSSTRVAEFVKILENTYRSVNIALVNELKLLAHRMDIDIFEVINAAATKPFGYSPFYPGPGLGGHCIPIDPFYLTWKAKEYDFTTKFIELAGEINTMMPDYVVQRTIDALNKREKCINKSSLLIMGVAYKKDVDDDRESPAYTIMDKLQQQGASLMYHDPWIPRLKPTRKYTFSLKSVNLDAKILEKADAVLILTDHSDFDMEMVVRHANLVIDVRNATAGIADPENKIVVA
ncbi:MAG: nucleotide sugar dehydrogenase [Thermodesulfobacteriota bacterium]|nr:nucleotide sugar dehydrogenase [Thermodesulfobacteriota bacterium]